VFGEDGERLLGANVDYLCSLVSGTGGEVHVVRGELYIHDGIGVGLP
jgi:hypothetical protein